MLRTRKMCERNDERYNTRGSMSAIINSHRLVSTLQVSVVSIYMGTF